MLGHESVSGRRYPGPGHSGEAACQNTLVFDPLLPLFSDALSVPVVILIFPRLYPYLNLSYPSLPFFTLVGSRDGVQLPVFMTVLARRFRWVFNSTKHKRCAVPITRRNTRKVDPHF